MKKIAIFDTHACSTNLGDQIIMDSVMKEMCNIFSNDFFINFPTHERIWISSYRKIKKSDFSIVGGSNLLSSNMNYYNQWKINLIDSFFINQAILMGVGWWQYQKKPNLYTRFLLRRVLNKNYFHSVRDNYTKQKLNSIGIYNVINTSCPTMWNLTPLHCEKIPKKKAKNVICTITDYNIDTVRDRHMIEILKKNYQNVYIWIQGDRDYAFINSLSINDLKLIPPRLEAFDEALSSGDVEYVGTRLHAGIRAMQFAKRCLIIGIDNRSLEISRDTNIKVILRENIDELEKEINKDFITRVNLPLENIEKWRRQFK